MSKWSGRGFRHQVDSVLLVILLLIWILGWEWRVVILSSAPKRRKKYMSGICNAFLSRHALWRYYKGRIRFAIFPKDDTLRYGLLTRWGIVGCGGSGDTTFSLVVWLLLDIRKESIHLTDDFQTSCSCLRKLPNSRTNLGYDVLLHELSSLNYFSFPNTNNHIKLQQSTKEKDTMPPPILLLKSPSPSPHSDPYTLALSANFTPYFVPVLTHTLLPDPLIKLLLTYLDPHSASSDKPFPYGALILTSQRAVAALNAALASPILEEKVGKERLAAELRVRLYVVGPATERAARQVVENWLMGSEVLGGEDAGSGEELARVMLGEKGEGRKGRYDVYEMDDGGEKEGRRRRKRPVMFLTGETRRDIIPKMLQSRQLSESERVQVDEMVVYQSTELQEFEFEFSNVLGQTTPAGGEARWIVVFSPMAGKGMLRSLGWSREGSGKIDKETMKNRRDFVCCIGPTTRAYLKNECNFEADVMARKPNPEGVKEAILEFMTEGKHRSLNQEAS